jgi:hypothetical protein
MKHADVPDPSESMAPPATNGTPRATRRNSPKRSAGGEEPTEARAPAPLAGPVAGVEAAGIDAPMWPLQSAAWFQPDVPPSPPAWSGLAIERHNRIPVPDFLPSDTAPLNRADAPDSSRPTLAAAGPTVPQSDLVPLGWDPRAVYGKERGK